MLAWLRETVIIVGSALVLSFLIKTFLFQPFHIPSGSMEDTLLIGDRVLVSKLTPGPFELERGDVVVFLDPGGWLAEQPEQDSGPLANAARSVLTFVGLLPQNSGEHLIKRVIGLPGDTVECCDAEGRVVVNGQPITEPYLAPGAIPSQVEFAVTVPEGGLWVMGDNRQHSDDSRANMHRPGEGTVPEENVVGTAVVRIWPFDRLGGLTGAGDTFAAVPEP